MFGVCEVEILFFDVIFEMVGDFRLCNCSGF